ncbi:family 2 encapsulin nanocompartment cargo protein polyprenyl transferase [Saccharopolyspora sp. ASAGF58]|uniref:family 2 encapsulin nanocompartment cargo protein polyprenyl transferase n=1 Tax=Saccharopolyspora sp. ASAGF58 TaxID=2719023 RepID=UPI00143FF3EC|nr:family 2 encapsulin nanocompartment cargo protein polyprenyl transferase [Saccharopolyspora sp. ASAGF58]QIZ36543.1 polyprenyl synthetase family protein [Saccharopolyspora sp. ASAGF58]
MTASDLLSWRRQILDDELRAAVDRLPGMLRRIAGYHFGWWDADGTPVDGNTGKAVRPALVLLSAEAVGGSGVDALSAAVAVELVHNFSLLHDDVMDADQLRRHRPTAWSVFGIPQAILAGDAMVALANKVLSDRDFPWTATALRWLNESVIELCAGQLADVAFEHRAQVDLAECISMVEGKTASLLGTSCALGALTAGVDADRVELLRRFGIHLGIAFQLVDDLLGIWGDPQVTGKPVGSDLARRKKSLPVIAALASGTAAGAELAAVYAAEDPIRVDRACELVELAGGRDWARTRADEEMTAAVACLDAADCVPAARAGLTGLASLVLHRNH